MFFGLEAVGDHPCYKMQEVVSTFFRNSVHTTVFSLDLFPDWIQKTLNKRSCSLRTMFSSVHAQLHVSGIDSDYRQALYEQLLSTNCIEALCDGTACISPSVIDWKSDLGKAIDALMSSLYESLDLIVFRKGSDGQATHELYREFIEKNKYICPFCGLDRFKNKRGARREDFDHYLSESRYPLAAANMNNLVPTCGTCNQDYKKDKDVLADGSAFYPYAKIPAVKVEVECIVYPMVGNTKDPGRWSVKLMPDKPDAAVDSKIRVWDRVYSVRKRIEASIQEYFEDWMKQVSDGHAYFVDQQQFRELVESAKVQAEIRNQRRMEPGQIVKMAFYDFILSRATPTFVESFRMLRNESYTPPPDPPPV